jgi:hypothetical protein
VNQFIYLVRAGEGRLLYGTVRASDGRSAADIIREHLAALGEVEPVDIELQGVTSKTFMVVGSNMVAMASSYPSFGREVSKVFRDKYQRGDETLEQAMQRVARQITEDKTEEG